MYKLNVMYVIRNLNI